MRRQAAARPAAVVVVSLLKPRGNRADVIGIMPRTTRTNRRSSAKFPPEYSRSLMFDDMPKGGAGGVPELEPWQYPAPKRLVGIIVCGTIKMRWCAVARSGRAVAN